FTGGGVLLAVSARRTDGTDDLALDDDREAAHKDGETALVLGEDAERLFTGIAVLVLVRRLAMAGRGERLVHRDLNARHLAAIQAPQRDRIAGVIRNAQDLGNAQILCFLLRRVQHEVGFFQRERVIRVHARLRYAALRPSACIEPTNLR